jgi:hypothetical protein
LKGKTARPAVLLTADLLMSECRRCKTPVDLDLLMKCIITVRDSRLISRPLKRCCMEAFNSKYFADEHVLLNAEQRKKIYEGEEMTSLSKKAFDDAVNEVVKKALKEADKKTKEAEKRIKEAEKRTKEAEKKVNLQFLKFISQHRKKGTPADKILLLLHETFGTGAGLSPPNAMKADPVPTKKSVKARA